MKYILLFSATTLLVLHLFAQGSLTPPGPPAPMMKTLQQVEPRVDVSTLTNTGLYAGSVHDITESGSYYLTENLLSTSTDPTFAYIYVAASNVTIDLNGFSISRSGSPSGKAVMMANNVENVVVRNGVIEGFETGIYSPTNVSKCVVSDVNLHNMYTGIALGAQADIRNCRIEAYEGASYRGIDCTTITRISDCSIAGFDNYAIFTSVDSTISSCKVTVCGGGIYSTGITSVEGCSIVNTGSYYGIYVDANAVIRDCQIYNAGMEGIHVGNNSLIETCSITNTSQEGIWALDNVSLHNCKVEGAGGSAGIWTEHNSIIEECSVNNAAGMGIRTGTNSIIVGCVVEGNGGNGIDHGGYGGKVENCTARNNGGSGFWLGHEILIINSVALGNTGSSGIRVGGAAQVINCNADANSSALSASSGISTGSGCIVSGCTASNNTNTNVPSSSNQGIGILSALSTTIENCLVRRNSGDGIQISSSCNVLNNTCLQNGNYIAESMDGAGIHATNGGGDNVIDSNFLVGNERGLDVDSSSNLIVRNQARDNSTNYQITTGNKIGIIVAPSGNTTSVNGSTGASGLSTTDPWANFSF